MLTSFDRLVRQSQLAHHPINLRDHQGWRNPKGQSMSGRNGKFSISRRALLAGGAAISMLPSRQVFAQSSEPLRIGFLTVKTGPLAAGGKQQEEGAALFLKERNGSIAGRKIELITQDTAGNPALAKTKTQHLPQRYTVPLTILPLPPTQPS